MTTAIDLNCVYPQVRGEVLVGLIQQPVLHSSKSHNNNSKYYYNSKNE
jgi:hypothetical protein